MPRLPPTAKEQLAGEPSTLRFRTRRGAKFVVTQADPSLTLARNLSDKLLKRMRIAMKGDDKDAKNFTSNFLWLNRVISEITPFPKIPE